MCSAVDKITGEQVAIKRIQNVFDNVADAKRILREIKMLRLLKHPDVVSVKHILLPGDAAKFNDIYIVFELMDSDLHEVIGANDDLTPSHMRVFLYQLVRGTSFLHTAGVLHRDLKPKNVLANSNCKLKICDFGLARPRTETSSETPVVWTDYVATRWYRAPELCGCFYGHYSEAVDIWSIGCIFAEMLFRKPLFPGRDAMSQLQLMTDVLGKPPANVIDRIKNPRTRSFLHALPSKPPKPFCDPSTFQGDVLSLDVLRRLVAFDPADRPSAKELLEHPYFDGMPKVEHPTTASVHAEFAFDEVALTMSGVRGLIFDEVARHYHPEAWGAAALPAILNIDLEANGAGGVMRQFLKRDVDGDAGSTCVSSAVSCTDPAGGV